MEMRSSPPDGSKRRVEAAQESQVVEVTGGFPGDAFMIPEEPEERDVWSMEMGDDSVFYSDEEDKEAIRSCDFGTKKCKRLVNSVAECGINQKDDDDAGDAIIKTGRTEREKEMTQKVRWTEEDFRKLGTPKAVRTYVSDPGDPAAEFVRTCEELLRPKCATLGMQTQHEPNKVNRRVEEAKLETQTSNPNAFDVFNEEGYTRMNREADIPEQLSAAEFKKSRDGQLQALETERSFQVHAEFPENPQQSALPSLKTSACSAFNHLTSSKYSTVSYRRIRRGNTRQKIEEFEFMFMKQ